MIYILTTAKVEGGKVRDSVTLAVDFDTEAEAGAFLARFRKRMDRDSVASLRVRGPDGVEREIDGGGASLR